MSEVSQTHEQKAEALKVLLIEDNPLDAELTLRALRQAGFEASAVVVQSEADVTWQLRNATPDVVLADYNLPNWRGIEALELLRKESLDVPMILVTGALGDVTAVECIKKGVTDYVLKDGLVRLPQAIRRALDERKTRLLRQAAEVDLARKVEELARSNKELEQFAYVASHDLQEPLRMVASYTQLLGERYRGKLDETADKYIGYAVEGAQRMQTLIQDLLAFSRAGRTKPVSSRVDFNLVVKDALQNLESAIKESGAIVTHGALPSVQADRVQLTQLMQNLIGNAIKFHKDQAPQISVEAASLGSRWEFHVRDNGIGMAREHTDAIFSVFKRLHTREEYPGNGIGLAICKKIVEQYGGKIWVESAPGKGSTFKFTLPGAAEPAPIKAVDTPKVKAVGAAASL